MSLYYLVIEQLDESEIKSTNYDDQVTLLDELLQAWYEDGYQHIEDRKDGSRWVIPWGTIIRLEYRVDKQGADK